MRMAPRTFRWSKRECFSSDAETINLVALVSEDSELFEAEAAELSFDESDDSFSLLIRNDSLFGEVNLEEYGTSLPRSLHSNLSAHSLATTSIVTPTHHAQTIEFNLISTSEFDLSVNLDESSGNGHHKSYSSPSLIDISQIPDFLSTLPVHILNTASRSSTSRSPSSWPWHLLAYTDFPVFVRAITSDLNRLWNLFNDKIRKHSSLIEIISCDSAFGLTTCDLTCCEAEIELVQCGNVSLQTDHSVKRLNPSTSTHTDGKDNAISTHKHLHTSHMKNLLYSIIQQINYHNKLLLCIHILTHNLDSTCKCQVKKRLYNQKLILYNHNNDNIFLVPLLCDHNQLSISNEMNIVLFPLSGIHPDLLQDNHLCISTYTAIYLLLVNNNCKPEITVNQDVTVSSGNMNHMQNARMTYDCDFVDNTHSDTNDHLHNTPIVLALLVQILPSHQFTCPITVQHKFSPSSMPSNSKLFNGQQFTVLLAVVDLLVSKNDSEEFQLHGVIHQRLHYLPDFKFELALQKQN
ncbi:Calcium uptake protein 1 mitochondrial [Schistosoma japonicum]|nr:Calcium uptake protein 1 mitochondrial [Schistosoma japonicum]